MIRFALQMRSKPRSAAEVMMEMARAMGVTVEQANRAFAAAGAAMHRPTQAMLKMSKCESCGAMLGDDRQRLCMDCVGNVMDRLR